MATFSFEEATAPQSQEVTMKDVGDVKTFGAPTAEEEAKVKVKPIKGAKPIPEAPIKEVPKKAGKTFSFEEAQDSTFTSRLEGVASRIGSFISEHTYMSPEAVKTQQALSGAATHPIDTAKSVGTEIKDLYSPGALKKNPELVKSWNKMSDAEKKREVEKASNIVLGFLPTTETSKSLLKVLKPEQQIVEKAEQVRQNGMLKDKPQPQMGKLGEEPFRPDVTKIESPKDLNKAAEWSFTASEADTTMLRQNWEKAQTQGYDINLGKKFRDYSEGSIKELSPTEQAIYDASIKPLKDDYERIIREYKDFGLDREIGARIAINHRTMIDRVLTGDALGGFSGIARKPSGMKGRTVFALEDGTIITAGKGGRVTSWVNGVPTETRATGKSLKAGDTIDGQKVVQAKQADIEKHTPIRYLDDDMAVWSMKLAEAKKFEREQKLLDDLKNSDYFKLNSAKRTDPDAPADWRPIKDSEKLPQLRDYIFEPKVREVFEDWIKKNKHDKIGILEGINNLSIKSFMIDPIPHIMNEGIHWYYSRGMTKWVTPKGWHGLATTLPESIMSVVSQDAFQMEMLKNGAPLLYPQVKNYGTWSKLLNSRTEAAMNDGSIAHYAKIVGMSPVKLFNLLTQKSNAVMWSVRDMMYTQLVKEQMAGGKSMQDALAQVGRHMPEYRLPQRILGSRGLSEVMQNRNVTVFSRYHYGLMKGLAEIGKELSTKGERSEGMDHLAALIVGSAILMPALDKVYQWMLQDEHVKARRAGPFHIFQGVQDIATGEKTAVQVMTSLLTPSPALTTVTEAFWNRQLFSGQKIYDESVPEAIPLELGQYAVNKMFAPGQAAMAAVEGRQSPREYGLKLLDVEAHDPVKEARKRRAIKLAERRARKRFRKLKRQYGLD